MPDPVLHVVAGPNGAGKSTLFTEVVGPVTHLEFVNADVIAADRWPGEELEHAYAAAELAGARRTELISDRLSFATETVFSHESKVQLLREAGSAGYRTTLHIVAVPVDLAVARVKIRAHLGGHDVPVAKIRGRFGRLWSNLTEAIAIVDETFLYGNYTEGAHFPVLAKWVSGVLIGRPSWPSWMPDEMRTAGH